MSQNRPALQEHSDGTGRAPPVAAGEGVDTRLRTAASSGILLFVSESARADLPAAELVRGLLAASPHQAVFTADGALLQAGAAVSAMFEACSTLEALGAGEAAAQALAAGAAVVDTAAGRLRLQRLGAGDAAVLLASLVDAQGAGPDRPAMLSAFESHAFQEIGRVLGPAADGAAALDPALQAAAAAPADADAEPGEGIMRQPPDAAEDGAPAPVAGAAPDAAGAAREVRELRSILDVAADGVMTLAGDGGIVSANAGAQALFGYAEDELVGRPWTDLLSPESQGIAAGYLADLGRGGVSRILNAGREVVGRFRQGGLIPVSVMLGRLADTPPRYCAVFRDLTAAKRVEQELAAALRSAESAKAEKAALLERIERQLRAPLAALLAPAREPFDTRPRAVLPDNAADMREAARHVVAHIDQLLALSRAEAGALELSADEVRLNEVVLQCVGDVQPQAHRARIIIRTALAPDLPTVLADPGSVRQIVTQLLTQALRASEAGGQMIISTALTDARQAVLRVRACLARPGGQTDAAPRKPGGSSSDQELAGSLSKALAAANEASLRWKPGGHGGTLAELIFPAARVLAHD